MSDVFKDAAFKVGSNVVVAGGDKAQALDPTQILAYLEILKEVIAMIQDCRKAREVPAMSSNPGFLEKRLLTNKVRGVLGLREFRRSGKETVEAILKTGAESTEKEIQELYDSI